MYLGRDAVIKASRHYWGTWEDYWVEAKEVLDADPCVVVILHERGRGKGTGVPFERCTRSCGPFAAVGSSDGSRSKQGPRPSKPPGCRSRGLTPPPSAPENGEGCRQWQPEWSRRSRPRQSVSGDYGD